MLVGAFEIHDGRCRRRRSRLMPARSGSARVLQHEGVGASRNRTRRRECRRPARIVRDRREAAEEALAAPSSNQASAPSFGEGLDDARDRRSCDRLQDCRSPRLLVTNTAIGTPQARWREITQSGRALDHAADAVLARRRAPSRCRRSPAAPAGAGCRPWGCARRRLSMRDEPLRRVAEDHRLLGAPGVRILVLQAAARDAACRASIERLDDGVVGVALLALVVDDALARRSPARPW